MSKGNAWNDPGNEAAINGQARFPDGRYTVNVTAKDAKGNASDPINKKVLLDNYPRQIIVKPNPGGVGYYIEKGSNFMANTSVDIWIVPPPGGSDVWELASDGSYLLTVQTDGNGAFFNVDIGNPETGGFFVADYFYNASSSCTAVTESAGCLTRVTSGASVSCGCVAPGRCSVVAS